MKLLIEYNKPLPFFLFLLKIATGTRDRYTIQNKTPANLECNARLNSKNPSKDDSGVDLKNKISIIAFRDNMPYILIDVSRFG